MTESLKRVVQAARFDRDAFVWMDFNDRATGDGLIIVLIARTLLQVGFGSSLLGLTTSLSGLEFLLAIAINTAVFWLAYSGIVYAIARFLMEAGSSYALVLRITAYAYPTLLLLLVTDRLVNNALLALILGSLWFLAIMAHGMRYAADLPLERAALAAGGGMLGWIIIANILGRGLI
ncbi:MAG TPA: hypothetical protein VLG28_04625 [Acidimicrobiia bacterium]|nr:hypothetical protein [Acidimicrobiia bacterium]